MIEFDTSKIIQLQYKERKILRELIHSYKDVLINKSNFKNIENLENESKSDDEFSDDLQSDSPKQNKVGPQNKKYNKKAGNTSKFKAYNKDAQRDFKFSVQNMEND